MTINRRSLAAGLTAGVLAGGAGGAIAATTSGSRMASESSRATGRWDGSGYADIASTEGKSLTGLESAIETAVGARTGTWDAAARPWHHGPDGPMTSGGW